MLNTYITQTQQMLANPPAPATLYSTSDITSFINRARLQIAGESQSIRGYLSLAVTSASQQYAFSAIDLTAAPAGSAGVFSVAQISYSLGAGAAFVRSRPWPWFNQYHLMDPAATAGPPAVWAQLGQGTSGTIWLNLLDNAYTLNIDAVIEPAALVADADPEALPYPWTECVPFFAAYYAYLSAQRQQDADAMFQEYQRFAARARAISTSAVLPGIMPMQPDPTWANKLALGGGGPQQQGGGAGG